MKIKYDYSYMNKGKECKFYPCHDKLEDCTFCYCPIYPCKIPETGGKFIKTGLSNKEIWDCTQCTIVHDKSFVDNVKNYMKKLIKEQLCIKEQS